MEKNTQPPSSPAQYYPINEEAARRAKEAMSFSDYRAGSATAEYHAMVDKAAEMAEVQKRRTDPEYHEKINHLLDLYARKLAQNMNEGYAIAARVPSMLIAGPANFLVRKKEKQNAAADRNMMEWRYIQGLLDRIRSTGMGGISADDEDAIEKLQMKLERRQAAQERMKTINAYYRKHKTLDGCPDLTPEAIKELKADMAGNWQTQDLPYPTWQLSNNNAEMRRIKVRIEQLTRQREAGYVGWTFDGGTVEANQEENRLQILFDNKPNNDTRIALRSHGFRWSSRAGAWQRQLNDNAIRAADGIKCIWPASGEKPGELQRKAGGKA